MQPPNQLTRSLTDSYIRYLLSAHPLNLKDQKLHDQVSTALRTDGKLVRGPIVEIDRSPLQCETVKELFGEGLLGESFVGLSKIDSHRRLYSHQVQAIRASAEGRNVVVASGTGTGKTEAWLYPVVNRLCEKPSSGLRAVVLYPMNALADDQRRIRLRGLLGGTAITYGEFTGNTPERDPNEQDYPLNEAMTRANIRQNPPNILITNPSMLEYLLLRPSDAGIFVDAQLEFLIVDEVHTYSGAYGIELAHLIRRLKARLGTKPASVRCFALSATLSRGDAPQAATITSDLFGETIEAKDVFFGEPSPHPSVVPAHKKLEAYLALTPSVVENIRSDPNTILSMNELQLWFDQDRLLKAAQAASGEAALYALLHDDGAVVALRAHLDESPKEIDWLTDHIFGPHDLDGARALSYLLDASSIARLHEGDSPVLQARYHTFFSTFDGLRVCFSSQHSDSSLSTTRLGAWYIGDRRECECGAELYELLLCSECGTWYLPHQEQTEYDGAKNCWQLVDDDDSEGDADDISDWSLVCRDKSPCACANPTPAAVRNVKRKSCIVCGLDKVLPVLAGPMASTEVLGEELTRAQDPIPNAQAIHGFGKKLLVFSDSRRSAAEFAAKLQRDHDQHVVRAAIYRVLKDLPEPTGLDEVAQRLVKRATSCGLLPMGGANNKPKARTMVYEEFTTAFASRRRLGALGLGGSYISANAEMPQELVSIFGGDAEAANASIQIALETVQYDSAVTRPENLSLEFKGVIGVRKEPFIGWEVWIGKTDRSRRRDWAIRLVGKDDAVRFLKLIWEYAIKDKIIIDTGGNKRQIDIERIFFQLPNKWFVCDRCGRCSQWALPGGKGCITLGCSGEFVEHANIADAADHFVKLVLDEPEHFSIEEHTAQLPPEDARSVGRDFRIGRINILSCSTTFELGVDIGELQAVFMRNVPPTVANYRQRAGRAGRTRRGPAFIATYCTRRPHDRVFFDRPFEIITGDIPVPVFKIENQQLRRRHDNSLFFSRLWKYLYKFTEKPPKDVDSLLLGSAVESLIEKWAKIAEADLKTEYNRYRAQLSDPGDLKIAVESFLMQLKNETERVQSRLQEIKSAAMSADGFARENLEREARRLRTTLIVDHLTSVGILPSYAFPIYVVELVTPQVRARAVRLQRDLRIALSEFAPPSQIVARKQMFESVGIVVKKSDAAGETPAIDYTVCPRCNGATRGRPEVCSCGNDQDLDKRTYTIPDGFTCDLTKTGGELLASADYFAWNRKTHVMSSSVLGEVHSIGPVRLAPYTDAELLHVNGGQLPKASGFRICMDCGRALPAGKRGRQDAHKTPWGKTCDGRIAQTDLAHLLRGDALALWFESLPEFQPPQEESFYWSLVFALLEGASRALAIERRDLDGIVRRTIHGSAEYFEVLILDNVAGGAGYVEAISNRDRFVSVLIEARKVVDCSRCAEDSACHGCLKTSSNQFLHNRLRRGPVLKFLDSLVGLCQGKKTIFVDGESWLLSRLRGQYQEIIIDGPTIAGAMIGRISLASVLTSEVQRPTIVAIDPIVDPVTALQLRALQMLLPKSTQIVQRPKGSLGAAFAFKDILGNWTVAKFPKAQSLNADDLDAGELLEGSDAADWVKQHNKERSVLDVLRVDKGTIIPLTAGEKVDLETLLAPYFDRDVSVALVNDRYIHSKDNFSKLQRVLDLIKTTAVVTVNTTRADDTAVQQAGIRALKQKLPRLKLSVAAHERKSNVTHDRFIRLDGDGRRTRILLPYGLDFADSSGVVRENTHVIIFDETALN